METRTYTTEQEARKAGRELVESGAERSVYIVQISGAEKDRGDGVTTYEKSYAAISDTLSDEDRRRLYGNVSDTLGRIKNRRGEIKEI